MAVILHMCLQPDAGIGLSGGTDMSTASHCQMAKPESCSSCTAVGWIRGRVLVPVVLMEHLIKSVHGGGMLRCWGVHSPHFHSEAYLIHQNNLWGCETLGAGVLFYFVSSVPYIARHAIDYLFKFLQLF